MLSNININYILDIAKKAGKEVLKIYNKDFEVEYKSDKSPLTKADKISHQIIVEGLKEYNLPILSEEGKNIPYEERKNWEYFWMIDPLDGTKEFIKRNGEFTINIALIHKDTPVFGVVYAPAIDILYFNDKNNAYKIENNKKFTLPLHKNKDKLVIIASKSHMNTETKKFIDTIKTDKKKVFISKGSSLKLCLVAEGIADIYPRLAPTMEWDTAAADAIVRKCNKKTIDLQTDKLLKYNKKNLLNNYFIVY
ncbi:3'(2'),5'-bisphosphate nucleotidase CysQ [Caminibacter mediatlanticus TB-2]|uniref:3'(2'),5'-bisphosphate nucleotidase CysQ n=1 Tax=Caminibacter mediatlanticus TB-2 TaxID=391592 RepID=A0ABX5VC31_9BACT|nr:3'(2'),5'-bisphosphate nucleotidase CysQ [Caminibacter mediatlanticus]QCT94710.1 3'(2'),5'-bisphosphate nucleotidase CysQ [Caminibacter mediatlanticus TB-2]